MEPIRIYPKYAMILKYDLRPGVQERYFRYATSEFLPAMQERELYMQNAWLVMYGDYPQRHIEFITEELATIRDTLDDPEWIEMEERLKSFTENYSRRVIRYQSNFKI